MIFKKSLPRILRVKQARYLTPNMIRVTFSGPELQGLPSGREGGNCKLTLPNSGQSQQDFVEQLKQGVKFPVRTYTVRAFREDALELDIDFVAHGTNGPASRWAMSAKPGDFCGFMGPSPAKVTKFEADWYVIAADMSALPLAAVTLEAMPRDAKGVAVIEIVAADDKQVIDVPPNVEIHWLTHSSPHIPSAAQEIFIRQLDWPAGRVQVCAAGESGTIKSLRQFLLKERGIKKSDAYFSGYWKIGLIEDEHQKFKKLK
jgi:NADPH-dependent ferric siderophore reductase